MSEHNATLLLSYNFAYGGATTDASLVTPFEPTVLSFADQVAEFTGSIAAHPASTPWTAEDTLFGVWMGVNDVGNSYYMSNVTDIMEAVVDRYFELLQVMYDAGGRNFVLLSVPRKFLISSRSCAGRQNGKERKPSQSSLQGISRTPKLTPRSTNEPAIYETPSMLTYSDAVRAEEATVIADYNDLLASHLATFTASNAGVTARLVDTTPAFQTVIDDPQAYGAANATCYDADGTTCIWFNDYHPGIASKSTPSERIYL